MKKHIAKIITGIIIAGVLAFVYWWGGNAPSLRGWSPSAPTENTSEVMTDEFESDNFRENMSVIQEKETPEKKQSTDKQTPKNTESENTDKNPLQEALGGRPEKENNAPMTAEEKIELAELIAKSSKGENKGKSQDSSDSTASHDREEATGDDGEEMPLPSDPEKAVITDKELSCTLSVRCDTVLHNLQWLEREKRDIIPQNGVILEERAVTFYEGESVFNVLLREMKRNKIHMEFVNVPLYNSAYIEGIANIYEFDCGELSGWVYRVNGWFPNYGSSRYTLKNGDRVEVLYTCNLGLDVGAKTPTRNGR